VAGAGPGAGGGSSSCRGCFYRGPRAIRMTPVVPGCGEGPAPHAPVAATAEVIQELRSLEARHGRSGHDRAAEPAPGWSKCCQVPAMGQGFPPLPRFWVSPRVELPTSLCHGLAGFPADSPHAVLFRGRRPHGLPLILAPLGSCEFGLGPSLEGCVFTERGALLVTMRSWLFAPDPTAAV